MNELNSMSRIETGRQPEVWSDDERNSRASEAIPQANPMDVTMDPVDTERGLPQARDKQSDLLDLAKEELGVEGDISREEQEKFRVEMVRIGLRLAKLPTEKMSVVVNALGLEEGTEVLNRINEGIAIDIRERSGGVDWKEDFSSQQVVQQNGEVGVEIKRPKSAELILDVVSQRIMDEVAKAEDGEREDANLTNDEVRRVAEVYLRADWRNLQTEFRTKHLGDEPIQVILELIGETGERGGLKEDLTKLSEDLLAGNTTLPNGKTLKSSDQPRINELRRILTRKIEDSSGKEIKMFVREQLRDLEKWATNASKVEDLQEVAVLAAEAHEEMRSTPATMKAVRSESNASVELPANEDTIVMVREEMMRYLAEQKKWTNLDNESTAIEILLRRVGASLGYNTAVLEGGQRAEVLAELSTRMRLRAVELFWGDVRAMKGTQDKVVERVTALMENFPMLTDANYLWLSEQRDFDRRANGGKERVDLTRNINLALGEIYIRMSSEAKDPSVRQIPQGDSRGFSFWTTVGLEKNDRIRQIVDSIRARYPGVEIRDDEVQIAWNIAEAECWDAAFEPLHPLFQVASFALARYHRLSIGAPPQGGDHLVYKLATDNYRIWAIDDIQRNTELIKSGPAVPGAARRPTPAESLHIFDPEGVSFAITGFEMVRRFRYAVKKTVGPDEVKALTDDVIRDIKQGRYLDVVRTGLGRKSDNVGGFPFGSVHQRVMISMAAGQKLIDKLSELGNKDKQDELVIADIDGIYVGIMDALRQMELSESEYAEQLPALTNRWIQSLFYNSSWLNYRNASSSAWGRIMPLPKVYNLFQKIVLTYNAAEMNGSYVGRRQTVRRDGTLREGEVINAMLDVREFADWFDIFYRRDKARFESMANTTSAPLELNQRWANERPGLLGYFLQSNYYRGVKMNSIYNKAKKTIKRWFGSEEEERIVAGDKDPRWYLRRVNGRVVGDGDRTPFVK